jgi:hypothetical protein
VNLIYWGEVDESGTFELMDGSIILVGLKFVNFESKLYVQALEDLVQFLLI